MKTKIIHLLFLLLILVISTVRNAESQVYDLGDINYASLTLTWDADWMQIDVYNGSTSSIENERINELFFDFHTSSGPLAIGPLTSIPSNWVEGETGDDSYWIGATFRDYAINKGSSASVIWDCDGGCPMVFDIDITYHDLNAGNYSDSFSVSVVPEPVSSLLFIAGGSAFAFRRFLRKRKITR